MVRYNGDKGTYEDLNYHNILDVLLNVSTIFVRSIVLLAYLSILYISGVGRFAICSSYSCAKV